MLRRNRNCFQFETVCKRIRTNLLNGIGDGDGGQGRAAVEHSVANGGNGIGNGDGGQGVAGGERAVANGGNGIGDGDGGQEFAGGERAVANGGNALWDGIGRRFASSRISNQKFIGFSEQNAINGGKIRMLRRNRNCFQCGTVFKRIRTNLFNGIGDGDGGQRRAEEERSVANGGNRLSIKLSRNGKVVCAPVVLCNFYRTIIQQRILVVTGRERLAFILRYRARPAGAHHHNDHQQS